MQNNTSPYFDRVFDQLTPTACLKLEVMLEATGMKRHQLARTMAKMVEAGLIERRKAGCYQLTKAGVKAKREGVVSTAPAPIKVKHTADTLRQRLWSVMLMSTTFSVNEIVMVVNWPTKNPEAEARRYLNDLCRAGYVTTLQARRGQKRFRLMRNSGQRAPIVSRKGFIHDPNTGEDVPCAKQA
ncbi:hypothetical protein [Agrobacterium larrymoorei]|uniref:DNA-binding PadR family transcriptional regulator n=1 Tax=Agrobacterium larrymoorei TaxID=160699 RepID=A0ABU0UKB1_9HYPH|nr:hypothetical protein [Agrobacterium larrymoorei]MDQ1185386.1 DNA-binding PadR family transcriptional regulator [Agrobacterium larrymoorei]